MFTVTTFERAVSSTKVNEIVLGLVNFPIWPSRWIIVVGFALMTLVFVGKVASCLHALVTGEELRKTELKLEEAI
jgi:TRAP-type mannitol/chloroaromatic compound transport system permease small subunit